MSETKLTTEELIQKLSDPDLVYLPDDNELLSLGNQAAARLRELEVVAASGFVPTTWHEKSYFKEPFNAVRIDLVPSIESAPRYAVRRSCWCLSTDGEWEIEPIPSSRDDEFFARCRFATFNDALAALDAARAKEAT